MFVEQWRALSGRIHDVVQAGRLHARFLAVKSVDTYGRAKRYSAGVPAGSGLITFRYLVVVLPKHITAPADYRDGPVVYRYINIAADPETPSQRGTLSTPNTVG